MIKTQTMKTKRFIEPLSVFTARLKKHWLKVGVYIFVFLLILQLAILSINRFHNDHPILGMRFEKQPVSQLGGNPLVDVVKSKVDIAEKQTVALKAGNYSARITARQLGARHSISTVTQRLLSEGRSGSLWHRVAAQDAAFLGQRNQTIGFASINQLAVREYLTKLNEHVSTLPTEAKFSYVNNHVAVIDEAPGTTIDINKVLASLQSIDLGQSNAQVNLSFSSVPPSITKQDLTPLIPQVEKVIQNPLTISSSGKSVVLGPQDITNLIQPARVDTPSAPSKSSVAISYNTAQLNTVLDQLAGQVNQDAKPRVVAGKSVVSAGSPGLKIDETQAKVAVVANLEKRRLVASAPVSPPAPTPPSPPSPAKTPPPNSKPTTPPPPPVTPPTPTPPPPPVQPTTPPKTPPPAPTPPPPAPVPTTTAEVIVPAERIDPSVVNISGTTNPLGRYPAYVNNKKVIYLTFDDGPGAYTEPLLDVLKRYNVHAIFFVIGRNSSIYPASVKRIVAEGHTIGNHSYTHSDLTTLKPQAISDEMAKTQTTIHDITNTYPDLFRPPYGSLNTSVYEALPKNNLSLMMWSVDPRDWSTPGTAVITQRVLSAATPGGNVLFHTTHQQTVDVLPSIIEGLRNAGYTLP